MKSILALLILFSLCGCASLLDAPKNVVGMSTRDMEDARTKSVYQTYGCRFSDCFAAVTDCAQKAKYVIFSQNEVRGLVVLMGVPGYVDTTEVGVFLTQLPEQQGVKVEVASRSSPAKRVVAQILFGELGKKFAKVK